MLTLMRRWAAGDTRAGQEFYRECYPMIRRFLYNKISPDESDDLVQSIFAECLAALPRYRGEGSFRAYVLRIANNQFNDYCRRRRRDRDRFAPAIADEVLSVADLQRSPFSQVVERQEARLLLSSLRTLPIGMQVLLELFYWERLTAPQIVEVLDIPEGTVRSRLTTARKQLERKLEELSSSPEELASTLSNLEGWALWIRGQVNRDPTPN